jgi:hypothetical protein
MNLGQFSSVSELPKYFVYPPFYGGRLGLSAKIENLQNYKTIFENQNSHIPHTYSQASRTFAARNRDSPVMYAHEVHAYCCAQQTGVHEMVVDALHITIHSTWVTGRYL